MYPLFLIGFMGSGKSTIGKSFSERYQCSFVDTDVYIESKYRMEIPKIFAKYGEDTFRKYEGEVLKEVLLFDIIATGGGIVERNENIQFMAQNGTIVYLHTTYREIDRRLQGDTSRPLWVNSDRATKRALYKRRHKLYEQCAHKIIYTDGQSVEQIVQKLANKYPFNDHNKH